MPSSNQMYEIVSVNSNKVLDVSEGSLEAGAPVIQFTYHDGTNQLWYFKTVGLVNGQEAYQIVNVNSGKVLDVNDGSTASGALIQQWEPTGGANQEWYLNPVGLINWQECYQIISVNSGLAVDVNGGSVEDGATIQQWTPSAGANQQWFLYPVASLDQNPQIVVETKFMQNYRVSSPVNGSNEIATVCNTNGQTELFTVGSDGNVYAFSPDESSETGYSRVQLTTGLNIVSITAGIDSQGQAVVFAAASQGFYYIVKTPSLTESWGAPEKPSSLNAPQGTSGIARIIAQNIAGNLYVALLWAMDNNQYAMTYAIWQPASLVFVSPAPSPTFYNLHCLWLGNTTENVVFANFSRGKIYLYDTSTQLTTYGTMTPELDVVSVDTAVDSTGNNQTFAILEDKNAYQLSAASAGTGSNPAYTWGQSSQGISFQQVATEVNAHGQAQIFAVSAPMTVSSDGSSSALLNVLYHWNNDDAPMPTPIYKSTGMQLGAVSNERGDVDLFTVDAQDHVTHLFQEQESENWTVEAVEVQTGPIEEYSSYSTDITLYDSSGAVVVNSPVTIWASEEARITVNGATFFIDPYHAGQISTNSAGMLSISQQATSLAIPSLQINFTEMMLPEESIVIQQYAGVQNRLATVTSDELMNATVADGSYLLDDAYRTPDNTTSMAQAFNQCMTLVGTPALSATTSPYLRKKGPKHGVWHRSSGSAADLRKLATSRHGQHWQLSLDGNTARYKDLTSHEAQALIAKEKATSAQLGGVFDWWGDVGDFLEGVVDEVFDVTNVIVTVVEEGVQAVISFLIDNVPYVFQPIITVIEQAFDLVQTIFAAFLVPFQKIFEWLAELFGWNDILRCKRALAYTANQLLGFLQGAAPGIQARVDSGFATLQEQIAGLFDVAVNTVGQSTVGGYAQSNDVVNELLNYALSNNFLYNELLNNIWGASVSASFSGSDAVSQFEQQLVDFATLLEGTPAFADATAFFQTMGSNRDQMFSQLLATLLRVMEELVQAGISGFQALIDALLQLVPTLVASLQSLFNTSWDIPFVSEFYSFITGGDQLTTLDVIALLAAIPTNAYYKSAYGAVPFPDDGSLTAFENSFNSQLMLQASGLASVGLLQSSTNPDTPAFPLPMTTLAFLAAGYAALTMLSGYFGAVIDAIPPDQLLEQGQTYLNYANYVLVFAGLACRFEWFFTASDLSDLTSISPAEWSYIAQLIGVPLIALLWLYKLWSYPNIPLSPERSSDIKAILFAFLGGINVVFSSLVAHEGKESDAKIAWRFITGVPWLAKILRMTAVVESTEAYSLAVLAIIDVLFNMTAADLGFFVLLQLV
jgi:hypothetical protein